MTSRRCTYSTIDHRGLQATIQISSPKTATNTFNTLEKHFVSVCFQRMHFELHTDLHEHILSGQRMWDNLYQIAKVLD